MPSFRPGLIALLSGLLILGPASRVALAADKTPDAAQAEVLFAEGRRLMAAGDYATACPKLANSQALDPAAGTALNLGVCYEKAGKLATAWAVFKTAEALAATANQKDRAALAKKKAALLEPVLSRLTIAVPQSSQVEGLAISRDGEPVQSPEWGVAVPRDGGVHDLEATAPGKLPWKSHVDLKERAQTLVVEVPRLDDAPATSPGVASQVAPAATFTASPEANRSPPDAEGHPGRTQRIAGVAVLAAGVVGLGVGGVLGLMAKSQDNAAQSESRLLAPKDSSNAVSMGNVATVFFGVGAAVALTGAVVWLTAPSLHSAVGTNGHELLLQGSF